MGIFLFSKELITETILCFKEENDIDLTPEEANEYLNSLAGLFLAFSTKGRSIPYGSNCPFPPPSSPHSFPDLINT